ncbi:MAG: class I SAM-dependent methyltransferase [Lachnospiraceae bacterium]|nr:class I SAM-dependent methyltransferase [Lachnospiraceae bacterium]
MPLQNIFDNEEFFEGYQELREREVNANNLFEIPERFALLPDLTDLRILDLGCGTGEHCKEYIEKGAKEVTGVDISEKMLEVAGQKNSDPNITYLNMPMEDIDKIEGEFDLAISSLAMHYVEDYKGVIKNVHRLLAPNGIFVFSQEHPIVTCHPGGDRWTKDESGHKLYANLADYGIEGERHTTWFVDDILIYHRMFSTVINCLVEEGFMIDRITEPEPSEELLNKYPEYYDLLHRPDFLLIRARRAN